MPHGRLEGRTALITGGSRGIGAAIARAFAAEGAAVGLLHLGDQANAQKLVAEIEAVGRPALGCGADVADPDAVAHAVTRVESELGPVDILVNCAGIVDETPFEAMTLEGWDRMIAVHLRGTFLMRAPFTRACGRAVSAGSSISPRRSPTRAWRA